MHETKSTLKQIKTVVEIEIELLVVRSNLFAMQT